MADTIQTPPKSDTANATRQSLSPFVIPTKWLEPIAHSMPNAIACEVILVCIEDELGISEHDMKHSMKADASLARHVFYRMAHVQFYVDASTMSRIVERNYQTVIKQMRLAWKGHFRSRGDKYDSEDFRNAYNRVLHRVSLMGELLDEQTSVNDYGYIARDKDKTLGEK